MCTVSSAAGRQVRIGDSRKGQHRRDQREAEEQKQRDGDKTSHNAILTKLWFDWCIIANALIEGLDWYRDSGLPAVKSRRAKSGGNAMFKGWT
jgi:hypothetical protein